MLLHTLWRMADKPYPFAAAAYDKGGVSRAVAVFATDALGPRGLFSLAELMCRLHSRHQRQAPRVAASAPQLAPSTERVNVVLIVVSSLRADRMDARRAPTMSHLAARGARFERAYVSMPQELPSWVTLMTGRHAHHHGIRSTFPTWDERHGDFDALANRFARAGYATRLITESEGDLAPRLNLGFAQRVGESDRLEANRSPQRTTEEFARELYGVKDQPFFFAVFFSALRFPHVARHASYAKYTDLAYRGRFKYQTPADPQSASPSELDVADIAHIRALYDGAVSDVDDAIAGVMRAIEREGATNSTVLVITADHGEGLYEDGHGAGFGGHLFGDESTHVPLVIYDPRIAKGSRSAGVVRDVDIAPTLYDLAGVLAPGELDGQSLAPRMRGEESDSRFAYAETALWPSARVSGLPPDLRIPYPDLEALTERESSHEGARIVRRTEAPQVAVARHRMVRDDRWKLVYAPTRQGVHYILFDTLSDPAETHDVALAYPEELNRLKRELWLWMTRDKQMEPHDGFLVPNVGAYYP